MKTQSRSIGASLATALVVVLGAGSPAAMAEDDPPNTNEEVHIGGTFVQGTALSVWCDDGNGFWAGCAPIPGIGYFEAYVTCVYDPPSTFCDVNGYKYISSHGTVTCVDAAAGIFSVWDQTAIGGCTLIQFSEDLGVCTLQVDAFGETVAGYWITVDIHAEGICAFFFI